MAFIHLTTFIEAPCERVFDLSRHVSVHKQSMTKYKETIVNSISGLMDLNDEVIWKARHLFKERILSVKISAIKRPGYFMDEQVKGDFKMMKHEHYFKPCDNGTIVIDLFHFESPYGILGEWFNSLYLTNYMKRLLEQRNKTIKEFAESERWKKLLIK